jgi:hypothetical protein
MGSSHDRRRTRRALQAAGLGHLFQLPKQAPPKPTLRNRLPWKRLSTIVIGIISLMSAIVGLVALWPWLSIQDAFLYDQGNPYSASLYIENNGLLPVTDIGVVCSGNFKVGDLDFSNAAARFPTFAKRLSHGGRLSLPCNHMMRVPPHSIPKGSEYTVSITYRLLGLELHQPQDFKFRLDTDAKGEYHWIYVQ